MQTPDEEAKMLAREAVISLPIPQAVHLERFEAVERLSEPFVIEVDVLCEEVEVDFLTHLGEAAEITITQDGATLRSFSGLIFEAEFQDEIEAGYRYRLTLRPWLYALTRNLDSIIFQQKTTVEIIQAVFDKRGCQDVDFTKLHKTYQQREYCVQYHESDFAFVSRLMEQEGIYYFFDHSDGRHVMVLCDDRASHEDTSYDELKYLPARQLEVEDRLWRWTETVATGAESKATFRDYDFTKPTQTLEGAYTLTPPTQAGGPGETPEDELRLVSDIESAPAGSASPADKAEVYDFPTGFVDNSRGQTLAETAMLAQQAERRLYRGAGDAILLACGKLVQLDKHPLTRLNQKYLVAGLTFRMEPQGYVSGGDGAGSEQPVVVEVVATPADVPWRAPRITPWPVARGPETATVVGPDGQTIYTDQYGRVKVRFHWDRADPSPDQTCFIRVAFASADEGFGHIVLPRIGQEVVVDYLSGDPDRPLIVGSLYNADKTPPYPLTADMTKSVWRSHTINGGSSDYNEISFEDKTDAEVFNVQAQKDRTTLVKHDDTTTIKNNLTKTIQEGDETREITKGQRTTTIEKNDTLTINQGDIVTEVKTGNISIKVDLGTVTIEALQSITFKVGKSKVTMTQTGIAVEGVMLSHEASVQQDIKAPITNVSGTGMATVKGGVVMIN
jgi:type VI secretion system secreted protein VgrG